jgi:hypothetical protein
VLGLLLTRVGGGCGGTQTINCVSDHNNNHQTAHLFGAASSVPPTPSYDAFLPDMPVLSRTDVQGMNQRELRQVGTARSPSSPRNHIRFHQFIPALHRPWSTGERRASCEREEGCVPFQVCRAYGVSPAGSRDVLLERMLEALDAIALVMAEAEEAEDATESTQPHDGYDDAYDMQPAGIPSIRPHEYHEVRASRPLREINPPRPNINMMMPKPADVFYFSPVGCERRCGRLTGAAAHNRRRGVRGALAGYQARACAAQVGKPACKPPPHPPVFSVAPFLTDFPLALTRNVAERGSAVTV